MFKKTIATMLFLIIPSIGFAADRYLQDSEVTTIYGGAVYPAGTIGYDAANRKYVFANGVASLAAANVVALDCISSSRVAAIRLTETVAAKGYSLGIAKSAPSATQYGWFQIWGPVSAVSTYANSKQAEYKATATAGYIAPTDWGGTTPIHGIQFFDASGGSGVAFITYPHTGN